MPNRSAKAMSGKGRIGRVSATIQQKPAPSLPHERDESADNQAAAPRKIIKQAAIDIKHGRKDTDRAEQMNQIYKRLKVSR